jgi:hypothetical protein
MLAGLARFGMQPEEPEAMPKPDPGAEFWSLIAPHTGAVSAVHHTERGFTSHVTAVVECEKGPLFIKALRLPSRDVVCLDRESKINEYVQAVCPRLRWRVRTEDWYVLAFDYAPGRPADFAPGSRDLPAVVDTLNRLSYIRCPPVASEWAEWRWDRFTDRPELFKGSDLVHSDINPSNFLIQGGSAVLVDWGYPTVGAGFIDPATLVVQLIASGRSPEDAQGWAENCRAWAMADPDAVDAFSVATVRQSEAAAENDPADWLKAMLQAAVSWAEHRKTL